MLASYSFGELSGPREQRQALKAMWQATDDMLVIIEPGTPAGSGLVRAARAQVQSFFIQMGMSDRQSLACLL